MTGLGARLGIPSGPGAFLACSIFIWLTTRSAGIGGRGVASSVAIRRVVSETCWSTSGVVVSVFVNCLSRKSAARSTCFCHAHDVDVMSSQKVGKFDFLTSNAVCIEIHNMEPFTHKREFLGSLA